MNADEFRRNVPDDAPAVLADVLSAGGSAGTHTKKFHVTGFDPRILVAVNCWFSPSGLTTPPTTGNTWSAAPFTIEDNGARRVGQNIFSGQKIPSAWEFVTGADGVEFTCSLTRAGSETGQWLARARVFPAPGSNMSCEEFAALAKRVQLQGPAERARIS